MYIYIILLFCISATALARIACQGCVFFVGVWCSPHYFSTFLLSYFPTFLLFYFPTFKLVNFSTMFTVGMFTVGMFTVDFGIVCVERGPPTSPPWPRRVSTFWCHFLVLIFGCMFNIIFSIWQLFGINFRSIFHHFGITFFEHCFHIGFVSILRWMLVSILMCFDTFSVRARKLQKPSKNIVLKMNLHAITHQEKH